MSLNAFTMRALSICIALMMLVACGGQIAQGPDEALADTDVVPTDATDTTESSSEIDTEDSVEATNDMRIVTHAMGMTEVSTNPKRVVVLDTGELDNALALGITPVGAPLTDVRDYQAYLSADFDSISDIGTISEPDLETILQLQPDLILGSKQRYEEIYDLLSEIAPTVFTESLRVPWQKTFVVHAEALGKNDVAQQILADYDERITQFQQMMGDQLNDITVSVVRFRPGQVRIYLKNSFSGYVLQDVGLTRPSTQDIDEFATEISLEQIADLDADVMFFTSRNPEENDLAAFQNSPLWQTLSAVQQEQVYEVDDNYWMSGLGVQAANRILDDLFVYFDDGQEATETSRYINTDPTVVAPDMLLSSSSIHG
ncbi:MAG: iron-siderophore ABC transporter substrate-binding protein [Chloroflexota bacterium]